MLKALAIFATPFTITLGKKVFCIMVNEVVSGHITKAISHLKSAQLMYDNELFDTAVSSSYYAVFHGASALLADKNMGFSKHKTVISKYNEVFVYPGLISSYSFRALNALFSRRLDSEYKATVFIGSEGAKEAIQLAKTSVQEILDYCTASNISWEYPKGEQSQ
jgi:uncharacterized protein (UPF0332 family)